MPAKDSTDDGRAPEGAGLQGLFGQAEGATPHSITLETLNKLTLKQLTDGARRLGLTAVSKLKKDALAKLVLDAWHTLHGDAHASVTDATPAAAAGTPAGSPSPVRPDAPPSVHRTNGTTLTSTNSETPDAGPFSHKFEVGQPGTEVTEAAREQWRESAREIPWGYGRDRVTAMPVDPDRLYAYWEVLDDSIAAARAKLGAGGPGAWLNLRVYDTTGRIFDGTNAHSTSDHRIERGDRQWFFVVGRPTSEAIIELGMKSHEGYFVKIARSSRVEFPRREPTPASEPEWLTVRVSTGHVEHGGATVPGRPPRFGTAGAAAGIGAPGMPPAPSTVNGTTTTAGAAWRRSRWQDATHFAGGAKIERQEWEEVHVDPASEEFRRFRWDGPSTITSWEAGPFAYPVEIPEPVRETFTGPTRVLRVGSRTHVLYGPWQVIIRGLGAEQSRVVLSRWEIHRTWAEHTGRQTEHFSTALIRTGTGASERMLGSSERRWVGSSEVRLAGSSELYFLQASETRLGGASELLYAGSSKWVMRGSSERRFVGASEAVRKGSSEQLVGRGFLGASEGRLRGPAYGEAELPPEEETGQSASSSGVYPLPPGAAPTTPPPGSSPLRSGNNHPSNTGES